MSVVGGIELVVGFLVLGEKVHLTVGGVWGGD